jgi:hypothetical protein
MTLTEAYDQTDYVVADAGHHFTLKVGVTSTELSSIFAKAHLTTAAFITAWNPYSRKTSSHKNEAANEKLWNELLSVCQFVLRGFGRSPSGDWDAEESFLGCGLTIDLARDLGRKYEQNAIIWIGQECRPELVMLVDQ